MLAVVPARGGSKGLKRKNVLPLAGVPLIVHCLRAARAAASVGRVLVTTDDDEIMRAAREVPGVEIPFRRAAHLAQNDTPAPDIYLDVADWLQRQEGAEPQALCILQPTSPLMLPEDIDGAVMLYRARSADAVLSVVASKPLVWNQRILEDQRLESALPVGSADIMAPRQRQEQLVLPNGAIKVLNVAALRRTRSYFGDRSYGYLMPADRSIDIDDDTDFGIAEALLVRRQAASR